MPASHVTLVFAASAAFACSAARAEPAAPSYGIRLIADNSTGRAVAKVYRRDVKDRDVKEDRMFLTFDKLQEFCASLPNGSKLKYVYPPASELPPGSDDDWVSRFRGLKKFCAEKGVDFHLSFPDW
jgi:hypothetical protein